MADLITFLRGDGLPKTRTHMLVVIPPPDRPEPNTPAQHPVATTTTERPGHLTRS
jgi:hypothetical protein